PAAHRFSLALSRLSARGFLAPMAGPSGLRSCRGYHVGQSEIANKNADCYSVTHSGVDFSQPTKTRQKIHQHAIRRAPNEMLERIPQGKGLAPFARIRG